jgi:hypothetical protein
MFLSAVFVFFSGGTKLSRHKIRNDFDLEEMKEERPTCYVRVQLYIGH